MGTDLQLGLQRRANSGIDENCLSRWKQPNVAEQDFAVNDTGFVQCCQRFQKLPSDGVDVCRRQSAAAEQDLGKRQAINPSADNRQLCVQLV